MTRACLMVLALVMATSAACSKRHTRGSGPSRDAGPRADTGPVPDSGREDDGGIVIMFDAGPRRDSGPVVVRDAGPGGCMGDRLDMAACGTADAVCRYGATCPEAMFPPYDDCYALLHEEFAGARTSSPDPTACAECLEAIGRAFEGFAATGVCPPPDEPPPAVAAECDSDRTVDSDGDGNAANDMDACGFS